MQRANTATPFLTTPESSVLMPLHAGESRYMAQTDCRHVSRSLSREALEQFNYDVDVRYDAILRASSTATAALVHQAQRLPESEQQPSQPHAAIMIYERRVTNDDDDEGEAAVDDDVVLVRPKHQKPSIPRLTGHTTIKATIDEVEATFAYGETRPLWADMTDCELLYGMTDEEHKSMSIQRLLLEPRGNGTTRRRDFVVVECQKRFRLPDGRHGWVQSVHSVDIPTHFHPNDCVRGTIHRSGVVVIESIDQPKTLDIVVTAQLNLHGNASQGANRAVSKRRITKVLQAFHAAVAQHRIETLTLPSTHRFNDLQFRNKDHKCQLCAIKLWRIAIPGWIRVRYTCRKCGGTVCNHCSRVWAIDRPKPMTFIGGGRVATATRVCTQCLSHPPSLATTVMGASSSIPSTSPSINRSISSTGFLCADASTLPESEEIEPLRPTQLEFHVDSHAKRSSRFHAFASVMKTIRLDRQRPSQ